MLVPVLPPPPGVPERWTAAPGLFDRAELLAQITAALEPGALPRRTAVVVVEVDRLRTIEAALGREGRDAAMLVVAGRLQAQLRSGEPLARIADDQFAVLCKDLADGDPAIALAARLVAVVARPLVVEGSGLLVTAGAGVAFDGQGSSAADMLHEALAARTPLPRRRPLAVEIYDHARRVAGHDRRHLADDLRAGIDGGDLRIAYQPLVTLHDRAVVGVEALVRWAHPTLGTLDPPRFLPVAVDSGLMPRIDAWVLQQACRQAALWSASFPGRREPAMTVNVSVQQLAVPGYVDTVAAALDAVGLPSRRLVLDIAEASFADDAVVLEALGALKDLGVRLFLDDFVTGNAALSWLTRFPLDGIKLEAAVVRRVDTGKRERSLVEAVCGMARAFDLEVVAEGVETPQQAQLLEDVGCTTAQGHLFGRPTAADGLRAVLSVALPRAVAAPQRDAAVVPGSMVTMREAAGALGVSASTVRRWSEDGRLAAVRTTGGHRRFLVDEIRRLRSETAPSGVRLRRVQFPEGMCRCTAAIVRDRSESIVRAGLEATYETRRAGWFAEEGRASAERWLLALADGLGAGAYDGAAAATSALVRQARLGGATTVELVTFLDRACAGLLRLVSEAPEAREELPAARRICAALRHQALEDSDG